MCYAQMRHLHLSLSPEHTHSFWVPELILGPWAAPRGGGAPPKDMENRSVEMGSWTGQLLAMLTGEGGGCRAHFCPSPAGGEGENEDDMHS